MSRYTSVVLCMASLFAVACTAGHNTAVDAEVSDASDAFVAEDSLFSDISANEELPDEGSSDEIPKEHDMLPDTDALQGGFIKVGVRENLTFFKYIPAKPKPAAALVVVLHGCDEYVDMSRTNTNKNYLYTSEWDVLAERYGFYLLLPQENKAGQYGCFQWVLKSTSIAARVNRLLLQE